PEVRQSANRTHREWQDAVPRRKSRRPEDLGAEHSPAPRLGLPKCLSRELVRMPRQHHKAYPIVVRELEVKEAYEVTPLMRRVVLTGEQLGAFRNGDIEIGPFLSENA